MYTVASVLKSNRQDLGFSLEEASLKTKIPQKYLEAFENEESTAYPSEPYCSLYVKNYALFLGLNGDNILALFRRDFEAKKNQSISLRRHSTIFSPQNSFGLAVAIVILFFVLYLGNELISSARPPELSVNYPAQISTDLQQIKLTGKTDPNATIRINQDLVIVEQDGSFSKLIFVSATETPVHIEAKTKNGKTTSKDIVLKKS